MNNPVLNKGFGKTSRTLHPSCQWEARMAGRTKYRVVIEAVHYVDMQHDDASSELNSHKLTTFITDARI